VNGQESPKPEYRDREQYVARGPLQELWKRSSAAAHAGAQARLYSQTAYPGKSAFNRAKDYLTIRVFRWVSSYVKHRFGRRWPFPDYSQFGDDNGIYELAAAAEGSEAGDVFRVSLTGDWGSGTEDADDIGSSIRKDAPHITIHLGDVYYVGAEQEVQENMLGGMVLWPEGSHGSFALNANHEMYSQGKAYFTQLLPELGLAGGPPQRASFFCLRNEHWLVIGLDTGYYSVGAPVLEFIFKPDARLHDKLMEWLRQDVRLGDDRQRGVILLSHHQYYSQFESGFDRPAAQIAELLDRPVLWFWGHEHRFAIYGRHASQNAGLEAYGRCVGHGGLPIEDITDNPKTDQKHAAGLVLYDRRERERIGALRIPVGYNGYANLDFDGRRVTVEYKDTAQALLRESWEVGEGGALKGISIEKLSDDADLALFPGAKLEDAID
jgi:hypothetical protein